MDKYTIIITDVVCNGRKNTDIHGIGCYEFKANVYHEKKFLLE